MKKINFKKYVFCPLSKVLKMGWFYRLLDCKKFEPPPDPVLYPHEVCIISGQKPNKPYCEVIIDYFKTGEEPQEICEIHKKPESSFSMLPLEITVPELERATGELKAAAPAFLKPALINTGEITNKEIEDYAEKITNDPEASGPVKFHGNYLRHLIGCGFYNPGTIGLLEHFFETIAGKYELYRVRQQWIDTFLTRAESFTKRRWTLELDPFNNSELHNFGIHPLHKDNNHGYMVPELGGAVHSTHTRADSFRGAFRLWDQWGPAWQGYIAERRVGAEIWKNLSAVQKSEETAKSTINEMTAADQEDMNQNRAVREFEIWYLDFIINLCRNNLDMTYIKFGANEWRSRTQIHLNIWAPIYARNGILKKDRMTSFDPIDWYLSGAAVFEKFLGCLHFTYAWNFIWFWTTEGLQDRVFSLDEVIEEILPPGIKFMFSSDGLGWGDRPKDYDLEEETTFQTLLKGLGRELNSDFKSHLFDIDFEAGRRVGKGLDRYVKTL